MEDYTVIIPDYLLQNDNDTLQNDDVVLSDQEQTEQENAESYDYSSILSSINDQLTELNTNIVIVQNQNDDLMQGTQGLLKNTSFLVYFGFVFFVFGALCLVIKFFKQFF